MDQKENLLQSIANQIATVSLMIWFLVLAVIFNAVVSCQCRADEGEPKHKIAIVDTGYNPRLAKGPKLKLCKTGHFDYGAKKEQIGSSHLHGTYLANILAQELENVDYCVIILNVMDKREHISIEAIVGAMERAINLGATEINVSFNGSRYEQAEREAFTLAGEAGIKLFVAAGNFHENFSWECLSYPACYDVPNMKVVGALDKDGKRAKYSNYGRKVALWFDGTYGENPSVMQTGTSFATPRALAASVKAQEQTTIKKQSAK